MYPEVARELNVGATSGSDLVLPLCIAEVREITRRPPIMARPSSPTSP